MPNTLLFRATLSIASLLVLAGTVLADITYTVKAMPDAKKLAIEIAASTDGKSIWFQMPKWSPGHYRYEDYVSAVTDVTAIDDKGNALEVLHPDSHTWTVANPSKTVRMRYMVASNPEDGVMHYAGPSTYMYVVGRVPEKCELKFEVPQGWKIAVGLDPVKGNPAHYKAADYDVLADNPVTLGNYTELTYTVNGKPHILALRSPAHKKADLNYLTKACQFITESQTHFFGDMPYNRYVWHATFWDAKEGAWGLEHLSSTQLGLANGLGRSVVGVLSHEFFHLWNVKRIRSKVLGPFNYQEMPQTGALWWLEGVTDYYSHLLLARYGWWDEQEIRRDILTNLASVRSKPARFETSPYESSFRVRDADGGRGNSGGYGVNYYDTGWLLGLCLDIEIQHQSKGKHSLDDVMHALYALTRNGKPGFAEDEIRKQCVRFGGEALGVAYDNWVMKPGELPVEAQLMKVGLNLLTVEESYADVGFSYSPSETQKGLTTWGYRGEIEKLFKKGDVVVAIEGRSIEELAADRMGLIARNVLEKAEPSMPVRLKVRREGALVDLLVTPVAAKRTVTKIEDIEGASEGAKEQWLYAGQNKAGSAGAKLRQKYGLKE